MRVPAIRCFNAASKPAARIKFASISRNLATRSAAKKSIAPSAAGKLVPDTSGAPRLALHAAELGFVHPITGKPLRFEAKLPPDLANFWRHLQEQLAANETQMDRSHH